MLSKVFVYYCYGALEGVSQHLIEKWIHENPSLDNPLWLEKENDEKGKALILKCKACIKFEGKLRL